MSDDGLRFTRRRFLIGAGAAGAAAAGSVVLGRWLDTGGGPIAGAAGGTGEGPLVIVTLYGGNDGLNTVVPYADPAYRTARPTLGYDAQQVLDLDGALGLNPKLPGMHGLWRQGKLAVVRGVGYPNPNLSHFASMDIWQTANPTDGTGPGWLGKWLDATGDDPMRAIAVGTTLPPMLRGEKAAATAITGPTIALTGPAPLQAAFRALQAPGTDRTSLEAAVAASGADLLAAADDLDRLHTTASSLAARGGPSTADGPSSAADGGPSTPGAKAAGSGLAADLGTVAALINAGAPTRVYEVSVASFDTHADEKADHERLLAELDGAITGFLQAVAGHPAGERAVVLTISEFGRRPVQNASGGTDHGAAAPLFVAGHSVNGGRMYGEQPSLTALDPDGNQVHTVDFRSVYATVLQQVVGVDPASVLGGSFPTLDFV